MQKANPSLLWLGYPKETNMLIHVQEHSTDSGDQGYADSGCSRHMTGNMSLLSDFKMLDGGYVTFGVE